MSFGGTLSTDYLPATRLPVSRNMENPNDPLDPDSDDGDSSLTSFWGGSSTSETGAKVTRKAALGYSPYFRAVSLISGDAGRCPLFVYRKVDEEYGEGKEKANDHPAYKLLRRRPNSYMTANVWKETMFLHACDKGNAYSYILRKGDALAGEPTELLPLDPDCTWPVRVNGQMWYVNQSQGKMVKIPACNILHIKGISWDGLSGMGWREIGKETLGLGIASRKFSSRFYKRGAVPSVVLEAPGKMTPKVSRQLRRDWERLQTGLENMHATAVLQQGTKAHTLSQNARDSQMAEMQMFNVRMVSTLTGVPPHKLGDNTRAAYNSLEQENQSYLDDALDHWLVRFEEECEDKLLTEKEKDSEEFCIEFNRKIFVQANLAARFAAYGIAKQNRLMTSNEIRAIENLNPRPDGDDLDDTAQVQQPKPDNEPDGAADGTEPNQVPAKAKQKQPVDGEADA